MPRRRSEFLQPKKFMKNNIKIVFCLYLILFLSLIAYIIKFTAFDSKKIISNSYNPRVSINDENIKRGSIYDCNKVVLAESIYNKGYERKYTYPEAFSHVIGYTEAGKSGIEANYNFELDNLNFEIWQRILNIFKDEPLVGNSLHLTIDSNIQNYAYKKLGKLKGAIVVMEPNTGKIIAMVSYPNFNPNEIGHSWNNLNNDKDSPLINRATQGLYPPGSTFKIITSASIIDNIEDYKNFTYECKGIEQFGKDKVRCFNQNAHGKIDLKNALRLSCNTFFSHSMDKLGTEALNKTASEVMFNSPLNFPLEYNKSSFVLNDKSNTQEIILTAIGQGKTLVTPLHMAMIVSSVANGGLMMTPYIVDHIEGYNGKTIKKNIPHKLTQAFSPDTSYEIAKYMEDVVTSGTAVDAKIKNIRIAGKTGTAENSTGKDHSWFVCFAPADNPKVTVVVILENAGKGSYAIPIARDILKEVLLNNGG